MHLAVLPFAMLISDLMPSAVIATISPGSTSRTNSAPIVSSAHDSDASIYALSLLPIQSGLKPNGSLAPISLRGLATTRE